LPYNTPVIILSHSELQTCSGVTISSISSISSRGGAPDKKNPLFSSSRRDGGLLYFLKYHKMYIISAVNCTPGETRKVLTEKVEKVSRRYFFLFHFCGHERSAQIWPF
jgi:hypothetical protein